ncbi:suppressor protein stp22 of temperature-sensitive alpha-factor receptor and arginine permease [Dipsacomyces acuminosporus]|nr:suppressor protein stp22 of temperature-sensitive alpha-factor receptor and arginine permease [Dipsacomyces acuminosporus]
MVVKASRYVDERGRVYHPYLTDWSDQSTLSVLFEKLIAVFSAEPPVYSRPPGQVATIGSAAMMSPSVSLGSVSMASLHQSSQASPASPASKPATSAAHTSAFVAPLTSVEADLASVATTVASNSSLAAHRIQKVEMLGASVDSAEQGLKRLSAEQHRLQAAGTANGSAQTDGQAADASLPAYKFNPVAGRPPVPSLSPIVPAQNANSRPVSQDIGSSSTSSGISWANSGHQSSPTGTLPHAANNPAAIANDSSSGDEQQQQGTNRRHSHVADNGASSGQDNRWSVAESSVSAADDQAAQAPASPIAATVPASTSPTAVATAAHQPARPTSMATTRPAQAAAATAAAAAATPTQGSSLLDNDPVDDPQKRLIGYQLAIFDRVFDAVKKSSEKHAKMNKELLDQSANLNSGAGVIAEERRQLSESQRQLEANIRVLEAKVAELQGKKTEFPSAQNISDIKQVFCGQTPAMEQLFGLAGEINAIDDTLYYLGKALDDGKLSLNTYMRQVRKLSQQQFMAKALAVKIRKLCGLDG